MTYESAQLAQYISLSGNIEPSTRYDSPRQPMKYPTVPNKCLKHAIKVFTQTCPHVLINDKPLANEELEF